MFKTCFCIVFCLVVALNATAYAQDNSPVVTSITPTSGLEWGGTPVRIDGTNFQSGMTVTFGDMAATDVRRIASSIIHAVTPAHPAGNVDVTVTNPDGQVAILENGFTFLPALFAPPTDYAAGVNPIAVFCADLDGDEDNDLAVADNGLYPEYIGTLSVFLNNGDGTFAHRETYGSGMGSGSVFCADLDGDGDNDIAVANWKSRNVSVFLNNGDGTFAPGESYGSGTGSGSVFCADLDGDGDNDLAVANAGTGANNVSILLNNGDGTFAPRVDYVTGEIAHWVFIADLDGDGDNDLAVANFHAHDVSVLLNNGDGTFAPKVDYEAGRFPRSVSSADLDGDGDNDLAVSNANINKVSVLLNYGDGTFAPKVSYDLGKQPWQVFIADLDGDGDNDLVVTCCGAKAMGNAVSVFLNHGDGTFAPKVDYVIGRSPAGVCIADLDGDGDNDLAVAKHRGDMVVATYRGTVSVLLNLTDIPTAVTENEELSSNVPETYFLSQNFPNPFNLSTTIRFELPEAGVVDLSVYNIYGQRIRKLLGGEQRAGHHSVLWDGKDEAGREVASGIYLYRLEAGNFTQTRKALLLR